MSGTLWKIFRGLALVVATSVGGSALASPANFVVLLFDDTGYADLGMTGGDLVPTPAIDSIARDGVTFTNGYVSAAVCSPSRAGLMTGRYQQRHGHEFNLGGPTEAAGHGLPGEAETIAEMAKRAGYRTGLIGKWHLGRSEGKRPTDQGFDVFHGLFGGSRSYFEQESPNEAHALRDGVEQVDEPDALYMTRWIGERAEEFVRSAGDEPYLLVVSFTAPHTPMHALPEDLEALDGLQGVSKKRRTYAAMLRALDRSVAGVLGAIDEVGDRESTAVFLINDNGGATDNGSDNGPYRGMKGSKWEGGIRVPFALRWPRVARAGSFFEHPVISLDIAATLAAEAGVGTARSLDGRDLQPHLSGEATGPVHEALFWRRGVAAAVRRGPWKLIRSEGNPTLLFDLLADPSERVDLSAKRPGIVGRLLGELGSWEAELAEPGWDEGEKWERFQVLKHRIEVETRQQERAVP